MAKGKLGKLVALSAVVGAGAWVYKKYDTIKSMYHKVSIFTGERYEFDEFDGEAIAAMFSGVMIDLSDVVFNEDEVYLDIYALCSGIRVLIPKDVEVVLEGSNHASGVQLDQDENTPKTRTLYINYNITASGLQITDNVNDCSDECCDDPECDDPECCSDKKSVVEEVVEDISDDVEPFVEDIVSDVTEEVEEVVDEVEETSKEELDKMLNAAAVELDEAAADVEDAIDEFIDKGDSFDAFDSDDESDDEFFE